MQFRAESCKRKWVPWQVRHAFIVHIVIPHFIDTQLFFSRFHVSMYLFRATDVVAPVGSDRVQLEEGKNHGFIQNLTFSTIVIMENGFPMPQYNLWNQSISISANLMFLTSGSEDTYRGFPEELYFSCGVFVSISFLRVLDPHHYDNKTIFKLLIQQCTHFMRGRKNKDSSEID